MTDIAMALARLIPDAVYFGSVTGNTEDDFNSISWMDERPKPSWDHIVQASLPTYQQELAGLNVAWQEKVETYNKSFALAALSDGPSEEAKKTAIRASYEMDKTQNTADRAALKAKYGIGGV